MRLIDADALMRKLTVSPCGTRYREYDCDNFPATLTLIEVKKMVRNEPTVAKDNNVPTKQPDPITGLVPCGCGGVVEQEDFHDGFFPYSRVTCRGCWTETTRCRCTIEEAHEMARIGWNISHGYVAKRGPWVKTADRLPTEEDANKKSMVLGWDATLGYRDVDYKFIVTYPRFIPWWMPIPPLPEVD